MTLTITPLPVPLQEDEHGRVRVAGTRVTLDTVINYCNQGNSPEWIAEGFPTLSLADIYAVIGYYLRHRSEVDEYLRQRQKIAEQVRRENEARFDPTGLRERLLARRPADRKSLG
jgi:uncharacterized protein (DUF433 family)